MQEKEDPCIYIRYRQMRERAGLRSLVFSYRWAKAVDYRYGLLENTAWVQQQN